jgi:hypothetical protein
MTMKDSTPTNYRGNPLSPHLDSSSNGTGTGNPYIRKKSAIHVKLKEVFTVDDSAPGSTPELENQAGTESSKSSQTADLVFSCLNEPEHKSTTQLQNGETAIINAKDKDPELEKLLS